MILKSRGWGIAVPVIPVVVLFVCGAVATSCVGSDGIPAVRSWLMTFVFFISSGVTFLLGKAVNYERWEGPDMIGSPPPSGYVATNDHTFFWIPIQYWALLHIVFGVYWALLALKIL